MRNSTDPQQNEALPPEIHPHMNFEGKWQEWLDRLYHLRRDARGSHGRPHKPVLLLAILDLVDRNIITSNKVALSPALITAFNEYFNLVRHQDDRPTIQHPFYFLCGDGFWQLVAPDDDRPLYEPGSASRAPGINALRDVYGRFNDELWALIADPDRRNLLREALISRYFPERRPQLLALAEAPSILTPAQFPPGRDTAFRHTVLEAYDYRCAACGIRVKMPNDTSLVDAAHIIPFSVCRNDRPDNGIALCPNHHWAMDHRLIAPCPDTEHRAGIWRVGHARDSRMEGQKDLLALAGRPVIPPSERKFYPAFESLRWREQDLNAVWE